VSSGPEIELSLTTLTLCFLRGFHFFVYRKCFSGVYDIDYRAWPSRFKIFQKGSGVTAVGVRGVYAFGGEVVEFLEVGVPVCS
jgi:hypothetical protein